MKIEVENVLRPGKVYRVDAEKYEVMRRAFLKVLPKSAPGLSADELRDRLLPHLPEALFPQGARAGWWMKAVQLDLEAKGIIVREAVRPLRWHAVRAPAAGADGSAQRPRRGSQRGTARQ
jgi:hypothetical protein